MRRRSVGAGFILMMIAGTACGPGQEDGSGLAADSSGHAPVEASRNFAQLVNAYPQARSKLVPWGNTFWPYKADFSKNGIASYTYGDDGKKSPAGKYDAAHGCQTHAYEWEMKNHGADVKNVQGWWGHCNGWSAASLLFPEPAESTRVNGIEFSRSDVKALLTEAGMVADSDMFGVKEDDPSDSSSLTYKDVVPDQFLMVLTNFMGKAALPVVVDRYTGAEVWNQPLAGYRIEKPKPSDYLGPDPHHPNIYRINVTSTLWWGSDEVDPNEKTPSFNFVADNRFFVDRTLKAEVWLDGPAIFDAKGNLVSSGDLVLARQGDNFVGGAWHNETLDQNQAQPDFMWVPYGLLDAANPDLNPPNDFDGNPYIDHNWLVAHFIQGASDDAVTPCSVPTSVPDPKPSQVPGPLPFPGF